MTNSFAKPTKIFLTRYYHDNAWWCTKIQAYDWNDAEIRCKKLGMQLDGEYMFSIPAANSNFLANLIIKLLNLFR